MSQPDCPNCHSRELTRTTGLVGWGKYRNIIFWFLPFFVLMALGVVGTLSEVVFGVKLLAKGLEEFWAGFIVLWTVGTILVAAPLVLVNWLVSRQPLMKCQKCGWKFPASVDQAEPGSPITP